MKKKFFVVAAILGVGCTGSAVWVVAAPFVNAYTSSTTIAAGRTFEVGEGKHAAFTVDVSNTCKASIRVSSQSLKGKETELVVLASGKSKKLAFGKDTKALFANQSKMTCVINLNLTGDVGNLSMGGSNY
jgi:hypothetical protein